MKFIQDAGIPRDLVTDGAIEDTLSCWNEIVINFRIHSRVYSQRQNLAEGVIRELKRLMRKHRLISNSPARLWHYLGQWCVSIRSLTESRCPNSRSTTGINMYCSKNSVDVNKRKLGTPYWHSTHYWSQDDLVGTTLVMHSYC